MNPKVDAYIARSIKWPAEMAALQKVLLGCGLTEEIKWGKPCYSSDKGNIAIMQEMKDFLALMFFKGALLSDSDGLLESQGPNSRSALRMCFRSGADVRRLAKAVRGFVAGRSTWRTPASRWHPPPPWRWWRSCSIASMPTRR